MGKASQLEDRRLEWIGEKHVWYTRLSGKQVVPQLVSSSVLALLKASIYKHYSLLSVCGGGGVV